MSDGSHAHTPCDASFPTNVGLIRLWAENGALTRLDITYGGRATPAQTPLLQQAQQQLEDYFAGRCKQFTLPLAPAGTPFQQEVWQALRAIPYGGTATYAQLAEGLGRPRAYRAVGQANHYNPLPILIPCHRVLAANGMGGYAYGVPMKRALLQLERS